MVSERLVYVKMGKNHFFDEKSQKWSLEPPPLGLSLTTLGPHYTLKNKKKDFYLALRILIVLKQSKMDST